MQVKIIQNAFTQLQSLYPLAFQMFLKLKKKIHVSLTGNLIYLVICFNKGILWLHSLYRIYQQKQLLVRKAVSFFMLSYNVKQLKGTHHLNITMH